MVVAARITLPNVSAGKPARTRMSARAPRRGDRSTGSARV